MWIVCKHSEYPPPANSITFIANSLASWFQDYLDSHESMSQNLRFPMDPHSELRIRYILLNVYICLQDIIVAIEDAQRRVFGLQYHPEVVHSERGSALLKHYVLSISGVKPDWSMDSVLEEQSRLIEQKVETCDLFSCNICFSFFNSYVLFVVRAVLFL